jgi:peptide-methionine (S)-S-oxide reductase
VFVAGCFWCAEAAFEGGAGHVESVEVRYDPRKIGHGQLLELFWRNVDVFDAGGQFCDRGDSYRAENYHQDYHTRNPLRYRFYRSGCGRDARLDAIWGPEARGEQPPWSRVRS